MECGIGRRQKPCGGDRGCRTSEPTSRSQGRAASVLLTVPTANLYVPHPHAPHSVSIQEPWREHVHLAAEIRWTVQAP